MERKQWQIIFCTNLRVKGKVSFSFSLKRKEWISLMFLFLLAEIIECRDLKPLIWAELPNPVKTSWEEFLHHTCLPLLSPTNNSWSEEDRKRLSKCKVEENSMNQPKVSDAGRNEWGPIYRTDRVWVCVLPKERGANRPSTSCKPWPQRASQQVFGSGEPLRWLVNWTRDLIHRTRLVKTYSLNIDPPLVQQIPATKPGSVPR